MGLYDVTRSQHGLQLAFLSNIMHFKNKLIVTRWRQFSVKESQIWEKKTWNKELLIKLCDKLWNHRRNSIKASKSLLKGRCHATNGKVLLATACGYAKQHRVSLGGIVGMRNRTTSRGAFLVCVKLTDIFQTSCFSSKMQRGAAARGFILVIFIGDFNRF